MTHPLPGSRTPVTQLIKAVLRMAAEHHRAGRRAEAHSLYGEVLALDPRNADALFLLGVLAREDGRYEDAHRLLAEAGRWAASRAHIDPERQLVTRLQARRQRKPVQAEADSWVTRLMPGADARALVTIAHA